jgi:hypothetical protein
LPSTSIFSWPQEHVAVRVGMVHLIESAVRALAASRRHLTPIACAKASKS